jgi:hypothetical protein
MQHIEWTLVRGTRVGVAPHSHYRVTPLDVGWRVHAVSEHPRSPWRLATLHGALAACRYHAMATGQMGRAQPEDLQTAFDFE